MSVRNVLMGGGGKLPTFISSSSTTGTGAIAVTAPAGIINGDLLVAICMRSSSNTHLITVPSGFSVIHTVSGSLGTLAIAVKTASSESGSYTWDWNNGGANSVSILVYRNATRVNTVGTAAYVSSASSVASSITPTKSGTLLAAFIGSGYSITAGPAGMTLRASSAYMTSPNIAVYDLDNQSAAATGTKTATFATSNSNAAILLQVTNEKSIGPTLISTSSTQNTVVGATLSIAVPSGIQAGDLLVSVVASNSTLTWTDTAGFTEVADQGSSPSLRVAYKVATGSEGSSYTFTASVSTGNLSGTVFAYRYASYNTVGSIGVYTTNLLVPSVTSTLSQSKLITALASSSAGQSIPIYGMSTLITNTDATSPSYSIYHQDVPNGPTGYRRNASSALGNASGINILLSPTRNLI